MARAGARAEKPAKDVEAAELALARARSTAEALQKELEEGKAKLQQRPIGPRRLGASGYWNQEVGTGIHVYQNRLTPLEVLTQNVLAYVFTCTNEICPMLFQEYPSGGVALH